MARLYRKWNRFAEEYLRLNMNGTRAYKATYGQHLSDEVAGASAARLLGKAIVSDRISQLMKEQAMGPEEVLHRLGQHARADLGAFMDIESMSFDIDLQKADELGITHLIKKVRQTTRIDNKTEVEVNTQEIELVDSQAALQLLGRHHKLFTDVTENTTKINIQGKEALLDRVYGDSNDPTS